MPNCTDLDGVLLADRRLLGPISGVEPVRGVAGRLWVCTGDTVLRGVRVCVLTGLRVALRSRYGFASATGDETSIGSVSRTAADDLSLRGRPDDCATGEGDRLCTR